MRGMCFTCIGDMSKMTADDILRVRNCECTPYAIAYWFYNNHHESYKNYGISMLQEDDYIDMIVRSSSMWNDIRSELVDMDRDIDYTEEYDEYVKYYEPHETILPGVMSTPMTYGQFISTERQTNMHIYYDDYESYARDRKKKYLVPVSYEEYEDRREQYAEDKKNRTLASC